MLVESSRSLAPRWSWTSIAAASWRRRPRVVPVDPLGIVGRIGCASHHSTCNGPTTVGSSPGVFQGTDAGLQWFVLGASRHWKMCSLWRGNNCAKLRGFTSSRLGRCTVYCHLSCACHSSAAEATSDCHGALGLACPYFNLCTSGCARPK